MPDDDKIYVTKREFYSACFIGLIFINLILLALRPPNQGPVYLIWFVVALQFYCIFKLRQSRQLKDKGSH